MLMGRGFQDVFAPILCMQNAALAKSERSLVLASIQNTPPFPAAANQMRRLFGPRENAARQDVLLAADLETGPEKEDCAARAAYRKADKGKQKEKGGEDRGKTGKSENREEGRTSNCFNRRTGETQLAPHLK